MCGIVWDRVGIVAIRRHLPSMHGGKLQVWARSRGLGSWKASGIGTIPWPWIVGSLRDRRDPEALGRGNFKDRHDSVAVDLGKLQGSARSRGFGWWEASGIGTIPWAWIVESIRGRHDPAGLGRGKHQGLA